jgi:hypothetical protein
MTPAGRRDALVTTLTAAAGAANVLSLTVPGADVPGDDPVSGDQA